MTRLLILTLLAPVLAGCLGSAPPVPRDHYYRLLVPMPAESGGTMMLPGVLTVELLQADGLLRERPLLYSAGTEAAELQQYNYHYWNDAPPRLLQDQMVTYLRRSDVASLVVTPDTRVRAEYQISGKAKRFERLVGGGGSKVVVEIEFALQRLSDDALLVVDTYSAEEVAEGDSVEDSILALNRATARVFDAFLSDVRLAATRSASLIER